MKTVLLSVINRRDERRIALKFDYDPELISLAKSIRKYSYSPSLQLWHYPCRKEILVAINSVFGARRDILLGKPEEFMADLPFDTLTFKLQDHHNLAISEFNYWLRSRRYSESTVETYTGVLKTFLAFHSDKAIREIKEQDIITFNNEYILDRKYSASYQNQAVNAIKLFFRTVAGSELNVDLIHRPKRAKQLPNVLSKDEVKAILSASKNIKHRAMLCLLYSCGLRRSELFTPLDNIRA